MTTNGAEEEEGHKGGKDAKREERKTKGKMTRNRKGTVDRMRAEQKKKRNRRVKGKTKEEE